METNQPNWVQITTLILAIMILGGGLFYVPGAVGKNVASQMPVINVPTAEAIAAAISIPVVDSEKVDRVCELTDGCEYWDSQAPDYWRDLVLDEDEDIEDALLDLLNAEVDEDDLVDGNGYGKYGVFLVEDKDTQVRAYGEDYDGIEGDWETKIFARVTFQDIDEDDDEHVYVVITSTFDEGEYDELTVEEVSRNFEFA